MSDYLKVTLRDMQFHVCVGILPHEREFPQPLSIDASVLVDHGQVLDYRQLYSVVSQVVAEPPLEYLETVADRIATAALDLNGVRQVHLVIRKPHVPLNGPLACAEVEVVRSRPGGEGR